MAIRRAVALEPNDFLYRNNWGDMLLHLKQYAAAENQYIEASKLNKKSSLAYLGMAKVYVELGDESGERELYEDALEYLNKIVNDIGIPEKDDDRLDYYFLKGYINIKLSNWNDAEKNFKKCGEDPKAKRNLRRIRNTRKKEEGPSMAIIAGGWTIAGLSIAGLILYNVLYIISSEIINEDLLKFLVVTFLISLIIGVSLPFIRSIRGPGGVGFEKEIAARPGSQYGKISTFESRR